MFKFQTYGLLILSTKRYPNQSLQHKASALQS